MNQIGAISSSNSHVQKKNKKPTNHIAAGTAAGVLAGALYFPVHQLTDTVKLTAKYGKRLGYMNMIKTGFRNTAFYMKGHAYKVLHAFKLPKPKSANKALFFATAVMTAILTAAGLGIGVLANAITKKTNEKSS